MAPARALYGAAALEGAGQCVPPLPGDQYHEPGGKRTAEVVHEESQLTRPGAHVEQLYPPLGPDPRLGAATVDGKHIHTLIIADDILLKQEA